MVLGDKMVGGMLEWSSCNFIQVSVSDSVLLPEPLSGMDFCIVASAVRYVLASIDSFWGSEDEDLYGMPPKKWRLDSRQRYLDEASLQEFKIGLESSILFV